MKQILLKTWLIVVCMLLGAGTMWATDPVKCTSTSDLVAGDVYYISGAGTYSSTATVMGLNTGGNNFPASTFGDTPCELTLGGDATNGWTFSYVDGSTTYYLDPTNTTSSNYLKRSTSITNYGKFTISFSDGAAVITSKGKSSRNIIRINGSIYSCYSSGQDAIYLYKKATAPTVAYTVTFDAGSNGTCSTTSLSEASAGAGVTVPSITPNTGYRFKGWSTTEATYTAVALTAGVFKPTENCTLYAYYDREYTAKFYVNGAQSGETQNLIEGETIVFPANPSEDGVTFMGWATAAIDGTQDDAPTMYKSATMGTNNVEYYAVFAVEEDNGPVVYTKVSNNTFSTDKKYVIGAPQSSTDATMWYFSSYNTSNLDVNLSWGTMTSTPATNAPIVFTLSGTANALVAQTSEGHFLKALATGNFQMSANSTTVVLNNSGEICNGTSGTVYKLRHNYNSGSGGLRWYSSTTGTAANFYEVSGGTTYSDYCTTVALDPKPTIVLSATELAEYAGNTNTSITASVSENAYTGALTVVSSAEAVATASISEGTITINALTAGNATITVTAPAVTGFRKNTATIAVTVSEKLAHGLSFSADVLNLTVGDTEFSEPTLSNPNSLPVVYSLVYATPANEGKVATINAETGKLTLANPSLSTETQGAVTVKASTVGDNSHAAGEVTYNLVVARKVTTTSWSNAGAAVNIDKDEIATLPTASNDGERNLFYESSNTGVATIDNTGAVAFVAYGTTTITVKTTATAEYAATSATYELTFAPRYTVTFNVNGNETEIREETTGAGVTAPAVDPIGGKVFRGWAEATIDGTTDVAPTFVTTSSLDGDKTLYAVFANASAGSEGSVNFDVTTISSIQQSIAERTQTTDGVTFTFSSVGATGTNNNTVQMSKSSTLTQDVAFAGNIKSIKFEGFGYSSTTNASMLVEGKKGAKGTYATVQSCGSSYTGADISFGSNEYDFFKITVGDVRTVKFTKMTVEYSGVTYSDYCTSIVPTATITLNAACNDGEYVYSTYSNASAWVVPGDLVVSEIGVKDGKLQVVSYNTDDVVPANTGVMVSAEKWNEGTKDFAVALSNEAGASVPGATNCLRPSGADGITADAMAAADADCTYYRLTMHNGTQIGFWWGAEGGAAFDLSANKAYLAVPKSAGSNLRLWFGDDTLTGIDAVETTANDAIFNLQGQRINRVQKGVNIINGRKVIR